MLRKQHRPGVRYQFNSSFRVGSSKMKRSEIGRSAKPMKRGGPIKVKREPPAELVPGTAREARPIYGPKSGKVSRICKQCGSVFTAWRSEPGKACSVACARLLRRTRVIRTCKQCGAEFKINPSQFKHYKGAGQYCSKRCHGDAKIATTAAKPIPDRYGRSRRSADREWQRQVRERDSYTCQRCGKRDDHIHAHHVAPRSRRPDLRLDVSNGKCLCGSCHQWVHHHPKEAAAMGLLSDASYERAQKEKLKCVLCGDKHFGLGYCRTHWRRFKKYGDPLLVGLRGHSQLPPRRVGPKECLTN